MFNINSFQVGSTYFATIPGNAIPGAQTNSGPVFVTKDTVLICAGRPILFDFSANDPNPGDSLSYSFYTAFTGGGINQTPAGCLTCIIPDPSAAPLYTPVSYINGYSFGSPLGPNVTINARTGLISGVAPFLGVGANEIFAITVLVSEWRNGIKIGEHYKDLQIRVVDCNIPTAILNPIPVTCDGFNITFSNNAFNNPTPTFYWEFNDPSSGINNTSTLENPTHRFTDTGMYLIKLVLNRGLQCGDSTTIQVAVYPGFFPGFVANAPYCVGVPVQFNDTTKTNYGVVDTWSWNFGDGTTLGDTSHQPSPQYTYNQAGTFNTTFIVSNSKGCKDTVMKQVTVLPNPILSLLPADTTYCGLDSLRLTATGTGTFTWSPATSISNPSSATPLVYPSVPTSYIVTLNASGCKSRDTVKVTPLNDLTNDITANPGAICQGDTLTLTGSSNRTTNVTWQWTPAVTLSSPNTRVTRAYPVQPTTYSLVTKWGKNCIATALLQMLLIVLVYLFNSMILQKPIMEW
jgi:PKD repeat protein